MFKCSFVLHRPYFCVLSLVLLLSSYSAFVSTFLLLLYMCIVLLYKINIVYSAFVQNQHSVYIAFVQNQHSVYCFCTKSMLVFHALLFYGIFPYHQMATHLSISSIYGSCKDSL